MSLRKCAGLFLTVSMIAIGAGDALAQQPAATAQPPAPEAGDDSSGIVVTGSRLRASGFTTPVPVSVVGAEQIEQRAPSTIAEVINEIPAFRQSTSPTQAQRITAGGGQNVSDLRGLGGTRTLTLVDGLRFTPTNTTGTTDITLLPTNLIERVEVVTGGASAAYGSDAVAGVVNFILKDRMQGVQGTIQYSESEHGDNEEPLINLAAGFNFADDRGHFLIGVDAVNNEGVGTLYTRDWARGAGTITFPAGRPANIPSQVLYDNVLYAAQTAGGVITSGPLKNVAFGEGGVPYNFQQGLVSGTLMSGGVNPLGYPFGNWPIRTPAQHVTSMARLSYDITPTTTAHLDVSWGKNSSNSFTTFQQSPNLIVSRDNPFMPASVRQAMIDNGLTTVTVGRVNTEYGGYKTDNDYETARVAGGLKGKVFEDWDWDADFSVGRTLTDQIIPNNINVPNQLAAYWVVAGPNGAPVCGNPTTNPNLTAAQRAQVQPGCVPFNIFGPNQETPQALDYITDAQIQNTTVRQTAASANLSGSPFSTWAGPLTVAVGAEWRKDKVVQITDANSQQNQYAFGNPKPFTGSQDVKEAYGEVGVPLARDMTFVKSLDLNAAIRRTDYSLSGAVTTWKVGLSYEPTDYLRFRATQSRDIRAPNLSELFSGGGIGAANNISNPFKGTSGVLNTLQVGNNNLKPEIADTFTAGVVIQPTWSWLSRFRASVDLYDIKLEGVIAAVGAQDIIRRCYNGVQEYCPLITFDSTPFGIALVNVQSFNQNELTTHGVDMEVSYRAPIEAVGLPGTLDIRALGTYVSNLTTIDTTGVSTDRAGFGNGGVPQWTWNANFNYKLDRLGVGVQARYTSSLHNDVLLIGPDDPRYSPTLSNSISDNVFPSMIYWNLSAQYDLIEGDKKNLQVFGVINNLFDRDPPFASTVNLSTGDVYDLVGRTYKVGLRFAF